MKFPYSMLLDFVDTSLNAEQAGELLTMAGFELEGIEQVEDDSVLEIKVMSNRGDGLSVFGLAREVIAKDEKARPTKLYIDACARFPLEDECQAPGVSIAIETEDCSRYACRLFHDVPRGASPERIQKRLRQAGMRPISVLVDLTNYVMLEVGQPLHAFDLEKLDGGRIVVRRARAGEKLTTLDGNEHELSSDQMMICDAARPVAAAGIMGGLDTEVSDSTHRVLLESAHFENASVRRTRRQLGLSTEASYRFERSVDPDGVVAALNRFAMLLAELDGGQSRVRGVQDVYPLPAVEPAIELSMKRSDMLLGMPISAPKAQGYLERLGFKLEGAGDPFRVIPPSWRPDVVREEDVIEELGRVHGYDKIPEGLPHGATLQGGDFGFEQQVDRAREELVRLGFTQIISHSLGSPGPLELPGVEVIGPRISASPEQAFLRSSLLGCVADAVRRNGGADLHLFEIGEVFYSFEGKYCDNKSLAIMSTGALYPAVMKAEETIAADYFSLKSAIQSTLNAIGLDVEFELPSVAGQKPANDARFHPTRQAHLVGYGEWVGVAGQIHPDLAEELSIDARTVMAEIHLGFAIRCGSGLTSAYRPVSRNPSVRRDIAILIDKSRPYREAETAIRNAVGDVLEKMWLFDVYEGKGIPEGKHSLAIALQLRKFGENFTDEEANQVRERAVKALEELGATQR